MNRFLYKLILPMLICVSLLSMNFVCASWSFSDLPIESAHGEIDPTLRAFEYNPEEVLPGGDVIAPSLGENHLKMIYNLVNEPDYGLNATKKPIIHNLLVDSGDLVYSNQSVTGGNLKHLMPDFSTETEKLYFVIEKASNTEYNAYTLLASDLVMPIDTYILVYKTIMKKDNAGKWAATTSYIGYARVNSPGIVGRAIDVSTWTSDYHS